MTATLKCPHCEQSIPVDGEDAGKNVDCPVCRQSVLVPVAAKTDSPPPTAQGVAIKQVTGLTASVLMVLSLFSPLAVAPVIGRITLLGMGWHETTIMIILAVITAWLAATRRFPGLWATGGISLLMALYAALSWHFFFQDMEHAAQNSPMGAAGTMFAATTSLGWGAAVPALGGLMAMASAYFHVTEVDSGTGERQN